MLRDKAVWIMLIGLSVIFLNKISKGEEKLSGSEDVKRISFNLYLNNQEHKRVYDILQKQQNKNAFIRDAIVYYNHGFKNETLTREDVHGIIQECMQEVLSYRGHDNKQIEKKMETTKQEQSQIDYDSLKNVF